MTIPVLFTQLVTAWHQDATSDLVDVLAAELAARIAATGSPVCLALVRAEGLQRLLGLAVFLDDYGITLRHRHRNKRDGAYVYAELNLDTSSDFAGAVVIERRKASDEKDEAA